MKRKYYKRCKYQYAYRFAPTGAIQPVRPHKLRAQKVMDYMRLPEEYRTLISYMCKDIDVNTVRGIIFEYLGYRSC